MDKSINEKLTIFNTVVNVLILSIFFIGGFVWADTNGVWHRAEDVIAGTFGADQNGGDYVFPNNLEIKNNLQVNNSLNVKKNINVSENICLGGNCHNSWKNVCDEWVLTNAIN